MKIGKAIVAIAIAILCMYIVLNLYNRRDTAVTQIPVLPEFSANDIFGKRIDNQSLMGAQIYIQFIDPRSISQKDRLISIISNFLAETEMTNILVLVKDEEAYIFDQLLDDLKFAFGRITIITENYANLKTLFEVPNCCEKYFYFDENGVLLSSGLNNSNESFDYFINKPKFRINNYLQPEDYLETNVWFSSLNNYITDSDKYEFHVISIFTDICLGCLSYSIINRFVRTHKDSSTSIRFLLLVPEDFTDNDINNIKSQMKIDFQVDRVSPKLADKLTKITSWHKDSEVNNLVFLIDKEGLVLDIMDINKMDQFFGFIKKL